MTCKFCDKEDTHLLSIRLSERGSLPVLSSKRTYAEVALCREHGEVFANAVIKDFETAVDVWSAP